MQAAAMDQDTALNLLAEGGVLVVLDMPAGTHFGMDYLSWQVGPKFRGVKMIPPGLHFVHYSAVDLGQHNFQQASPRTGFFQVFGKSQLVALRWDPAQEGLNRITDKEELLRLQTNLLELDRFLGAFQFDDTLKKWLSLSSHISPGVATKLSPEGMMVCAGGAMDEGSDGDAFKSLPFTPIPRAVAPPGATGAELTKHSRDRSFQCRQIIDTVWDGDYRSLLGELQLAFVTFLIGHVYEGFEQWKLLVNLLCNCDSALVSTPALFFEFMVVLHYQLQETPRDFFVDIVSRDNFLTVVLQGYFERVEQSAASADLKARAKQFQGLLTEFFEWDFAAEAEEPEDERPVVVEL